MVEEQTLEVQEKPRLFGRRAWYRRRIESLEEQTVIDELTGLRNQRALWRELNRRTPYCSASDPLTVLMLDFDLFREINEGYGHVVGDAVLRRAASILRSAAGSPRLAFRYGGEEFVVLAELAEEDALKLGEEIRAEVARQNGALPAVTLSCGVAELDTPTPPWVALDRADEALRRAKRAGRNRVVVAGRSDTTSNGYLADDLEHETARRAAMALAVATLEARDTATAHHCDDVVTLCEAIGRRLDLDERALKHLRAGAQLHDVGKVAVPSSILNKPSALTTDEWDVIREHTIMGERILRAVPEMAEVATIVRHSHERWDGAGYPDGLMGERIPLASRIILCADAFHAIRSDRPYRQGRHAQEAIAEIQACSGTQFDPRIVEALVDVAAKARTGDIGGAGLQRKRLVVLLTTLAIGSGSAVAGIPEVRDALRSVFATSTPPSVAAATGPQDFDLGAIGDLLLLEPRADKRDGDKRKGSVADDGKQQREERPGSAPREARFGSPDGGGPSGGAGELRGAPGASGGTETGSNDGANAAPVTPDAGEDYPGKGLALGRTAPVPRQPAQPPSQNSGGRTDPPALGLSGPGDAHAKGKR